MNQIREFNETFEDATIVERTELNINDVRVAFLDVFIRGNKVQTIDISKGYILTFSKGDGETDNYLSIDVGEYKEDGMYSFSW